MRLRKKWWARPEMEESPLVIINARDYKGKWQEVFNNNNPIHLELGCGFGKFIATKSKLNPNINYVGIDLKDEVLVNALKSIENEEVENARLIPLQISFVDEVFDKDEISKIYINFCNPWPKDRHKKRRLTYTGFLEKYKTFLKSESEIWFKTDDKELFDESQEYFKESGFEIKYITYDLHNSDFDQNIKTEYETKFSEKGMNIMFLIAKLKS